MAKSLVLSDSSIPNHYGFYVDHSTLDLSRFSENPILLYMHRRGDVHGMWKDIRYEGPQLLGTPDFDVEDADSNKIAGKVKRGYLNGASLYLNVTDKTEFVQDEQGRVWMKNAEVWEASIVDIPSNKKSLAVKLFANGKEVDRAEAEAVKFTAIPVESIQSQIKIEKQMSKITLSAKAIAVFALAGITPDDTEDGISAAVSELGTALQAEKTAHGLEKTKREQLEKKIKDQEAVQLNALLDQAVTDGQILADQKETFAALGYDQAKTIIAGLPKAKSLSAGVAPQGGGSADPKTMEEFFKLSTDQQLAFKDANPAAYQALFA